MSYLTSFDTAGFYNSIDRGRGIKADREAQKAEGEYRNVLGGMIGEGDYQGAAGAAASSGRFEDADKLFEYMGTLDEKQSAEAQQRAKALAAVAQAVKGVPPEQRLGAVQQGQFAGLAESFGLDVSTLTPESLSDQSLDRVTSLAIGMNDELYKRTRDTRADLESDRDYGMTERMQDWTEEDGRFDNELSRDKFGEDVRSNKAGEANTAFSNQTGRMNAQTNRMTLDQEVAEYEALASGEGPIDAESEQKLRKEFTALTKEFPKVRDAYARIEASVEDPSPAGDLALIFNYMKMLDPGSVVRESEFATAATSGSYGERFKAAIGRINSGERLSPQMRADFLNRSRSLYQRSEKIHTNMEKQFQGMAGASGLDAGRTIPDMRGGVQGQTDRMVTLPMIGNVPMPQAQQPQQPTNPEDPLGIR